ncbi:hypothetical protein ColLi_13988 [Colletotrichum liriopes]|uniref:Uncharacterized protein n=1 Tax=Colletotrichum liriopes TaxID=708192 RepID=A0AA37LZ69_9PEZI|nr:hypothetical protein ColLi_13988 [Colletotrichum liriopes]
MASPSSPYSNSPSRLSMVVPRNGFIDDEAYFTYLLQMKLRTENCAPDLRAAFGLFVVDYISLTDEQGSVSDLSEVSSLPSRMSALNPSLITRKLHEMQSLGVWDRQTASSNQPSTPNVATAATSAAAAAAVSSDKVVGDIESHTQLFLKLSEEYGTAVRTAASTYAAMGEVAGQLTLLEISLTKLEAPAGDGDGGPHSGNKGKRRAFRHRKNNGQSPSTPIRGQEEVAEWT